MSGRACGLCGMLSLLLASVAHGQLEYARVGGYLGIGGTVAVENFRNAGPLSVDDSAGFNLRAGVRVRPHLALEFHFEWIEGFDVGGLEAIGFPAGSSAEIETFVYSANAKLFLLTGRVQPFALAGTAVMETDTKTRVPGLGSRTTSEDAFALRLGGGIDAYLTRNVLLSLDATYVIPTGDADDLDYLSLSGGLQYRF